MIYSFQLRAGSPMTVSDGGVGCSCGPRAVPFQLIDISGITGPSLPGFRDPM